MNRKTLTAGAVFAGLLVLTLVVLRSPEKGSRTGEAARPVAKAPATDPPATPAAEPATIPVQQVVSLDAFRRRPGRDT